MRGYYVIKNKEVVRNMIKKSGMDTQKNLAEIVGIGEDYISQIMNGKPTTRVTAYAFCKAISANLEVDDLFELF